MNTNSAKQRQILGGYETNSEMWYAPYSDTGSTDGTVAGNSINGSLDRTANYIDSYLEAKKPVKKIAKKSALSFLGTATVGTGIGLLAGYQGAVTAAIGSGGFGVAIAALAIIGFACGVIGILKAMEANKISKIADKQEKEIEKQAEQNIALASTNSEKEFRHKQQWAEQNLIATSNINDARNQARQMTANGALLQQSLQYANIGHALATTMDKFNEVDAEHIQDAQRNLQQMKLFGLESSRINKTSVAGFN